MYVWTAWCPKSPVYQLFVQRFVQADNKEPPYIRITGPFGEGNPMVTPSNLPHNGISIFFFLNQHRNFSTANASSSLRRQYTDIGPALSQHKPAISFQSTYRYQYRVRHGRWSREKLRMQLQDTKQKQRNRLSYLHVYRLYNVYRCFISFRSGTSINSLI